ncbi:MAG: AraC family ligand binding domain-containing protein [Saprospiraceae bacterium]|nr:AraC family ligand binding domain-containing protein [Saprospiraceae bacterium]
MVNYKKYLDIETFEGEISKHEYPWHFHDSYTFVIVEKGSIIYELKDKSILVVVYSYQADPSNGAQADPLNGGKLTP